MSDANPPTSEEKKNELELYLSACNICGQSHDTHECPFLLDLHYVSDSPVLSRARQTLPDTLEISRMADGSTTVLTKVNLQRGTTFGPLYAKRIWTMNPLTNFPIRVFGRTPAETYHLDYSNENNSNWMCFVVPASNAKEQNLICYQVKHDIFYTAMRAIPAGEELRVWYAPYYALKMKMPLYNTDFANVSATLPETEIQQIIKTECNGDQIGLLNKDVAQELAEKLPAQHLGARDDKAAWTCRICSTVIYSVVAYAKHLMEHYKPLIGVHCNICNRKFNNFSALEKHRSTKHSDEVSGDGIVGIPTSECQQQQNAQTVFLNISDSDGQTSDAMKDILEKFKAGRAMTESSLLLSSLPNEKENQSELPLLDTSSINVNDLLQNNGSLIENASLKSILENQCLNMNLGLNTMTDSMLTENISGVDSVKFNVEELASDLLDIVPDVDNINKRIDNLECDICVKKFDKVDYLYRHLRKHTGEFICPSCFTVFARKENLLSHTCFSQKLDYHYECPYCQKPFMLKKYLKRHIVKHSEWNNCKWCHRPFTTQSELEAHKCLAPKHICVQCGKRFVHRTHLNRHVKLHNDPKPATKRIRKKTEKPEICEKCGDVFKNPYSLKQHLRSHGERTFECDVCHRRFHRIGVLKEHKAVHQSAQIPCNICGKTLKSKKALDIHMLLHGNKKYQCDKCDKSFFQRCNYLKHYNQVHREKVIHKCPHCMTQFTSKSTFDKHVANHTKPAQFTCTSCQKSFHKEYQLKRHVQTSHSGIIYRCPFCRMTARHRHSMRRHFERQHNSLRDDWDKPGFVNQLAEKTPVQLTEQNTDKPKMDATQATFDGAVSKELRNPDRAQGTSLSTTEVHRTEFTQPQMDSSSQLNMGQVNCESLNGQEILLQVSGIDQQENIGNADLSLSEVPQLSISESDSHLAESVLGNAYIFGEDGGDIMFYVLDNAPVSAEY
ncbi:PR domain zinc finger protein 15 isoform X2 [Orussus abietinus]|uniref:PR domain zinc finger protein 15 isoform X2 n=1 Tax=Orussus abietinus TaxID=222816 RepID=UPI000625DDEA|nr:PR domain zinc finger protein 15 isoform X2 [Orussus abietinus]